MPRLWFAGYARNLSFEVEAVDGAGVQDLRIGFDGMGVRQEVEREFLVAGQTWKEHGGLTVVPEMRGYWAVRVGVSCRRGGLVREHYGWADTVRVQDEPKNRAELHIEATQGELNVTEDALYGAIFQGDAHVGHKHQVVLGEGAFRKDLESYLDEVDEQIELSDVPLDLERREPLDFVNCLGMAMTGISPGRFQQGSPEAELGRDPFNCDEQLREVSLTRGFWMSCHAVTQHEWNEVMEEQGSKHAEFSGERMPAQGMSWEEARKFCDRITESAARTGQLPEDHEYRLPTEAEWEYACRAGIGCEESRHGVLERIAVTAEANCGPQEIGRREANAWGLHDMLGNVFEWCLDAYGPYRLDQTVDPFAPGGPDDARVIRGGCFQTPAEFARFAARCHVEPEMKSGRIGFRVVLAEKGWPAGQAE